MSDTSSEKGSFPQAVGRSPDPLEILKITLPVCFSNCWWRQSLSDKPFWRRSTRVIRGHYILRCDSITLNIGYRFFAQQWSLVKRSFNNAHRSPRTMVRRGRNPKNVFQAPFTAQHPTQHGIIFNNKVDCFL